MRKPMPRLSLYQRLINRAVYSSIKKDKVVRIFLVGNPNALPGVIPCR